MLYPKICKSNVKISQEKQKNAFMFNQNSDYFLHQDETIAELIVCF